MNRVSRLTCLRPGWHKRRSPDLCTQEKGQLMRFRTILALCAVMIVASCGDRTMVERTGPDELLKLRSGPGLGFNIIMGLPDGTELDLRDCVTEVGQRWCEVSLVDAPQVTGYVSADYLSGQ